MKKFPFLLLDAGPIIKIFQLCSWDKFIEKCDITVSRTVAEQEVVFASKEDGREWIDLSSYEKSGAIKVIDLDPFAVQSFWDKFDLQYKADIDPGEKETLAFLYNSSEPWKVCSADHVVYKVLGLLRRGEQGISLEEMLNQIGLQPFIHWNRITPRDKDWKYTKKFREYYTQKGQTDSIQNKGFI